MMTSGLLPGRLRRESGQTKILSAVQGNGLDQELRCAFGNAHHYTITAVCLGVWSMKGSVRYCQQLVDRSLVLGAPEIRAALASAQHSMGHANVGVLDFSAQWYDIFHIGCEVLGPISLVRHSKRVLRGPVTCPTFSSEESFEYHEYNIWNPMLASLCHF